mgnify:CR=1 FL=1
MEIELQQITYHELKNNFQIVGDNYDLIKKSFNNNRKKALFSNPNLDNDDRIGANIVRADGVVVGYCYPFPTKFKAGNEILNSSGATALEVYKEYQKYAPGVELIMATLLDPLNKAIIYADLSEDGLKFYKAARFTDFALPKMIQPNNSRFIFENFGFRGIALKTACFITNMFLKPYIKLMRFLLKKNSQRYRIKHLTRIPSWVTDIVVGDGHKYMELHNNDWMQWCLDNCFSNYDIIPNYFYAIYDEKEQPIGFFLIKERAYSIPSRNISRTSFGTIMEWGTVDTNILCEYEITKIATSFFSAGIDAVQFATSNISVIKKMKKFGFFHHGFHHIVYKNLTEKYKDSDNPDNWRLRFGYSDSIIN